ncbi:MAG TPA: adenylate/guanylate cyclase domain-containing protein [Opitutaceae bacterium]|nr:adenylate/guanylate cyclase domain-containing protein [Opitutaceae bacterium]
MPQAKKKFTLPFVRWLLLLPIPVIWCLLNHFGFLEFFERRTLDWRFRARGELTAPISVIYVDVDSQSLSEIGGTPWSRDIFSEVAEALINNGGARAVGMDFVFSTTGMSQSVDRKKQVNGNLAFRKYLMKNPPVVLAAAYAGQQFRDINGKLTERSLPLVAHPTQPLDKIEPPEVPELEISFDEEHPILYTPPYVGLIDTMEGGTRFVPAFAPTAIKTYPHMAIELARLYWGLPLDAVKIGSDHIDFLQADGTPKATVPLIDGQLIEVNWFSHWISPQNPRLGISTIYQYAEFLQSEDPAEKKAAQQFFSENDFKGAVVLIGPVDPLLQDLAPTSFDDDPVPKVGVHGNLLKTIVSGQYLRRLPVWGGVAWLNMAVIFGLTFVISAFAAAGGTRGLRSKLTAALLLTAYVWLTFELFADHNLELPLVAPLGSVFTTSFVSIIWQLIEEERQKGRIKGMFGTYVSPQLVNRMVEAGENPQLGGHEDEITAYFSDIQSFSTFSEKLPPARLVELMNEYLTVCTDIVQSEGGTLDKYIGDAVVAMFGAPVPLKDHAYRACVASQLVHQQLGELRTKWKAEGDKWPEIVWKMQSRIGLNSGVATIGNMGSRTRFNYTMMGDNVNLAARMESGAKSWGAYTMVTETTRAACIEHGGDRVVFRPLGRIVVMGRSKPVPIYEIVGLKETLPPTARDCIGLFEQALERYYARDWDGAIALFNRSVELEPNQPGKTPGVKTNPSLVYIGITEDYKTEPPPENWDGVYVMKEK